MENDESIQHLPEALVEDMLDGCEKIGDHLLRMFKEKQDKKELYRSQLEKSGLLHRYVDLPRVPHPTTCGVDGSYVVKKLVSIDLVAVAAIAVEGLTPPSEKKEWDTPHHNSLIQVARHNPDNTSIVRGIMWEMEIILAAQAPHDVVFLDGSITNPFLNLNAAISKLKNFKDEEIGRVIGKNFEAFLKSYRQITCSKRSDKLWVGVPKYTSKREVEKILGWSSEFDDKDMLTTLLDPGEYVGPVKYEQPEEEWHIGMVGLADYYRSEFDEMLKEIVNAVNNLYVCYYKPHSNSPAFRIEVPASVALNDYQLSRLFCAFNFQCETSRIMEPYPLYSADFMVKNLKLAVPVFSQIIFSRMAESFDGDLSEILFSMQSYRTEGWK